MTKISLAVGCILIAFCAVPVWGLDVAVSGDWSGVISSTDLMGGADTDLNSSYTSNSNQGAVTITGAADDSDLWRLDVRRSDAVWHNGLAISVKRTSSGTGGGAVSGGTDYIAAGAVDTEFFRGRGDRSAIEFEFKLSGVSVQVPPNSYATSIILTVVDI